jgi:hypothetical protein
MEEDRYIEYYQDGKWIRAEFKELKKGMRFKIYEPDGVLYTNLEGKSDFFAESDAYEWDGDGSVWTVETSYYVEKVNVFWEG